MYICILTFTFCTSENSHSELQKYCSISWYMDMVKVEIGEIWSHCEYVLVSINTWIQLFSVALAEMH